MASETHGYDTTDHLRVDPRLGDDADLDALSAACRDRGLRDLLDGVFNHVGRGHPAFQAAVLEQGPAAATASWFRLRWPGGPEAWTPGTVPVHEDFEGHSHLVALDHRAPAVRAHVVEVMTHWLDRGADGWRLGAAYAVPPSFWAQVAGRVPERHPDAYLMGEVIHGDYAAFVSDAGIHAVTQYELWKAVWSSLNDDNFIELDAALRRHEGFLGSFVPYTFLGNHDVTRIASRLSDARHLAHALVVLLTSAGTRAVYAGDEHPFRGVKEDRARGRRRRPPAVPVLSSRPLAGRAARLSPAPGAHRAAPSAPLAARGPDDDAAPHQRAAGLRGRRGRGTARGGALAGGGVGGDAGAPRGRGARRQRRCRGPGTEGARRRAPAPSVVGRAPRRRR